MHLKSTIQTKRRLSWIEFPPSIIDHLYLKKSFLTIWNVIHLPISDMLISTTIACQFWCNFIHSDFFVSVLYKYLLSIMLSSRCTFTIMLWVILLLLPDCCNTSFKQQKHFLPHSKCRFNGLSQSFLIWTTEAVKFSCRIIQSRQKLRQLWTYQVKWSSEQLLIYDIWKINWVVCSIKHTLVEWRTIPNMNVSYIPAKAKYAVWCP